MNLVGYSDKYKNEVFECLKRNFKSMCNMTYLELNDWINPLLSYTWANEFSIDKYPFKYGVVLINNEKVVGYLGLIYSRQYICGKWKTVVNFTTWAIDKPYRIELVHCISEIQNTADVLLDFTPRKSIVNVLTQMFSYKYIDSKGYLFLPKLVLHNELKIKKIKKSREIKNENVKKIYEDHIKYGLFCSEVTTKNKRSEYIIYKMKKKELILKGLVPLNSINVLYTSDNIFFGRYYKEIISKLQYIERAALKTDSRFFSIDENMTKKFRVYNINRLAYGIDKINVPLSSLYTELSILINE